MRIIDLSQTLEHEKTGDPPTSTAKISYVNHQMSIPGMLEFFPGVKPDELPSEEGWAYEMLQLATHTGTHMDAPYHWCSRMVDGTPAATIDEIPLDWYFQDAVKLDFGKYPVDKVLTSEDYKRELQRIGYTLKPFDIVLVQSGAAPYYGSADYMLRGVGSGREATLWLTEQGIRVTGTDAWSWDRPLALTAEEFARTRDKSSIWEGHYAGAVRPYCHIEKMTNLNLLPSHGFQVACFPIKIHKASGGWVRPVALVP